METIHESERTSLLTPYNVANNVANNVALAAGSLLATLILNGLGLNATSYTCLFAASTLFRGLILVLLRRVPAPPRLSSLDDHCEPTDWRAMRPQEIDSHGIRIPHKICSAAKPRVVGFHVMASRTLQGNPKETALSWPVLPAKKILQAVKLAGSPCVWDVKINAGTTTPDRIRMGKLRANVVAIRPETRLSISAFCPVRCNLISTVCSFYAKGFQRDSRMKGHLFFSQTKPIPHRHVQIIQHSDSSVRSQYASSLLKPAWGSLCPHRLLLRQWMRRLRKNFSQTFCDRRTDVDCFGCSLEFQLPFILWLRCHGSQPGQVDHQ